MSRNVVQTSAIVILVVLLTGGGYCGGSQYKELKASRDSLETVRGEREVLWEERSQLRSAYDSLKAVSSHERDSLDVLYTVATARDLISLTRLDSALAHIPDTVFVELVRDAIEAGEERLELCEERLESCDEIRNEAEAEIVRADSTRGEMQTLLDSYQDQLNTAVEATRPRAGILRWGERGLAVVGAISLLRAILSGGG